MSIADISAEQERAAFTAEQVAAIPMFFIIGKGRSGTTLLQTLLDANPSVLIPVESRFIIHLKSKYAGVRRWNEKKILAFYNDLHTEVKFLLLWQVDGEKLKRDLLALKDKATFAMLCKVVYLNYISAFEKQDIKLLGDKNPIYTVFAEELLELYPGSKFIHLVRDYRDNILSHIEVFLIKNVPFLARKWVYFNRLAERLKKNNPGTVLTVRYEDLVSEPAKHLEEICKFLGVDYDPAMLDFHREANGKMYDRLGVFIDKFHSNIRNPVNTNKVEVWKKKMDPEQVRIADHIAGEDAETYGYKRQYTESSSGLKWISLMSRIKMHTWLIVIRTYFALPLWVRAAATNMFKLLFGKDYKMKKEMHGMGEKEMNKERN